MNRNDIQEWLKEIEKEIRDAMKECNTCAYMMWMSNGALTSLDKSQMVSDGYTHYEPGSMRLKKAIDRYMFIAEHIE